MANVEEMARRWQFNIWQLLMITTISAAVLGAIWGDWVGVYILVAPIFILVAGLGWLSSAAIHWIITKVAR